MQLWLFWSDPITVNWIVGHFRLLASDLTGSDRVKLSSFQDGTCRLRSSVIREIWIFFRPISSICCCYWCRGGVLPVGFRFFNSRFGARHFQLPLNSPSLSIDYWRRQAKLKMHSSTADIDSNYFNYCQVESDNHSIIIEIEQFPEVPPIKKKKPKHSTMLKRRSLALKTRETNRIRTTRNEFDFFWFKIQSTPPAPPCPWLILKNPRVGSHTDTLTH